MEKSPTVIGLLEELLGIGTPNANDLIKKLSQGNVKSMEGPLLEFKAAYYPSKEDRATKDECRWNVIEAIVGMANARGGCVILGISEDVNTKALTKGDCDPDGVLKRPCREEKDLSDHTKRVLYQGSNFTLSDTSIIHVTPRLWSTLGKLTAFHVCKFTTSEPEDSFPVVAILVEPIPKGEGLLGVEKIDAPCNQGRVHSDTIFVRSLSEAKTLGMIRKKWKEIIVSTYDKGVRTLIQKRIEDDDNQDMENKYINFVTSRNPDSTVSDLRRILTSPTKGSIFSSLFGFGPLKNAFLKAAVSQKDDEMSLEKLTGRIPSSILSRKQIGTPFQGSTCGKETKGLIWFRKLFSKYQWHEIAFEKGWHLYHRVNPYLEADDFCIVDCAGLIRFRGGRRRICRCFGILSAVPLFQELFEIAKIALLFAAFFIYGFAIFLQYWDNWKNKFDPMHLEHVVSFAPSSYSSLKDRVLIMVGWSTGPIGYQAMKAKLYDSTQDTKMVRCPPCFFEMGSVVSEDGRKEDEVQHRVEIKHPFWISESEVSWGQWRIIMGAELHPKGSEDNAHDPVSNVSWAEANAFCDKLTERDRKSGVIPKTFSYRLPTEAEWEFAAREALIGKLPIVNMTGGVSEWCYDWYGPYSTDSNVGEILTELGVDTGKVIRGGNWDSNPADRRCAARFHAHPTWKSHVLGFRYVLAENPNE